MYFVEFEEILEFRWDCPVCGESNILSFSKEQNLGKLIMSEIGLGPKVLNPYLPYQKYGRIRYEQSRKTKEHAYIMGACCNKCFHRIEVTKQNSVIKYLGLRKDEDEAMGNAV